MTDSEKVQEWFRNEIEKSGGFSPRLLIKRTNKDEDESNNGKETYQPNK